MEWQDEPEIDGWCMVDSDDEDEKQPASEGTPGQELEKSRVAAAHLRPEYITLAEKGLTNRPTGCTIGMYPSGKMWRAGLLLQKGKHFGRSWGADRTPRQALIRVIILMLEQHLEGSQKAVAETAGCME